MSCVIRLLNPMPVPVALLLHDSLILLFVGLPTGLTRGTNLKRSDMICADKRSGEEKRHHAGSPSGRNGTIIAIPAAAAKPAQRRWRVGQIRRRSSGTTRQVILRTRRLA
jgi:hypothetical protein